MSRLSPRNIRRAGDGAKLISGNDTAGYTFRGRFETASEAVSIARETTEKAHSALRWLISRQGFVSDGQVMLAWISGKEQPPSRMLSASSCDILSCLEPEAPPPSTGEEFAARFRQALTRQSAQLEGWERAAVMGLDAATPGRLSVTYYREMDAEDLMKRIADWHESCSWLHTYRSMPNGTDEKGKVIYVRAPFIGAPSPWDIAQAAYGENVDDKLKKNVVERLLPCIIDGAPVPEDLMRCAAGRAVHEDPSQPQETEKTLSIACALIRKVYNDRLRRHGNKEEWQVALDESNNNRDYLFGRALAYARKIEERAQRLAGNDSRTTNAQRMKAAFVKHPASTWKMLALKLEPYMERAGGKLEADMHGVIDRIPAESFNDRPLSPLFELGYASQLIAFRNKTTDTASTGE